MKPFKIISIFSIVIATFLIAGFYTKSQLISKKENISTNISAPKIINTPKEDSSTPKVGEITVTEEELNNSLPEEIYKVLEEPKIDVTAENILINGKIKKLFGQNVYIKILPQIESNRLELNVIEAKISVINAPKSLIEKIISPLESKVAKNSKDTTIESINLENDRIIIKIKK